MRDFSLQFCNAKQRTAQITHRMYICQFQVSEMRQKLALSDLCATQDEALVSAEPATTNVAKRATPETRVPSSTEPDRKRRSDGPTQVKFSLIHQELESIGFTLVTKTTLFSDQILWPETTSLLDRVFKSCKKVS